MSIYDLKQSFQKTFAPTQSQLQELVPVASDARIYTFNNPKQPINFLQLVDLVLDQFGPHVDPATGEVEKGKGYGLVYRRKYFDKNEKVEKYRELTGHPRYKQQKKLLITISGMLHSWLMEVQEGPEGPYLGKFIPNDRTTKTFGHMKPAELVEEIRHRAKLVAECDKRYTKDMGKLESVLGDKPGYYEEASRLRHESRVFHLTKVLRDLHRDISSEKTNLGRVTRMSARARNVTDAVFLRLKNAGLKGSYDAYVREEEARELGLKMLDNIKIYLDYAQGHKTKQFRFKKPDSEPDMFDQFAKINYGGNGWVPPKSFIDAPVKKQSKRHDPYVKTRYEIAQDAYKQFEAIVNGIDNAQVKLGKLHVAMDNLMKEMAKQDFDININIMGKQILGSRFNYRLKQNMKAIEEHAKQRQKGVFKDDSFVNALQRARDVNAAQLVLNTSLYGLGQYHQHQDEIAKRLTAAERAYELNPGVTTFFDNLTAELGEKAEHLPVALNQIVDTTQVLFDLDRKRDKLKPEAIVGGVLRMCYKVKDQLKEIDDGNFSFTTPYQNSGFGQFIDKMVKLIHSVTKHCPSIKKTVDKIDSQRVYMQEEKERMFAPSTTPSIG